MHLIIKSKIYSIFSSCLILCSSVYANELIPPKEILDNKTLEHYFLKVKQSYHALDDKAEECHKEAKSNTFTSFDYNNIHLQNIDKFKFIFYIYAKNQDACERESFKNLTYDIFMLRSLLKENKIKEPVFLDNIMSSFAVPSLMEEELNNDIAYKKLPIKTKKYLEKTLGTRPFDFKPFMDKQTEEYEKERKLKK